VATILKKMTSIITYKSLEMPTEKKQDILHVGHQVMAFILRAALWFKNECIFNKE